MHQARSTTKHQHPSKQTGNHRLPLWQPLLHHTEDDNTYHNERRSQRASEPARHPITRGSVSQGSAKHNLTENARSHRADHIPGEGQHLEQVMIRVRQAFSYMFLVGSLRASKGTLRTSLIVLSVHPEDELPANNLVYFFKLCSSQMSVTIYIQDGC